MFSAPLNRVLKRFDTLFAAMVVTVVDRETSLKRKAALLRKSIHTVLDLRCQKVTTKELENMNRK